MAHNTIAYIGRQAAWHTLGTVTGKYQTSDDLLADPGFQFDVFKSQLRDGLNRPIDAWGTFRWDWKDKVAGNKEGAIFLATVGKDYHVIPYSAGLKNADMLINSVDGAHYETAGVLGKGERMWALADVNLSVKIGDDVQKGYLLFSTSHDGSIAHRYGTCFTRVVCQNTLYVALSEKARAALTIRHTKNAAARIENAREALAAIGNDVVRLEDRLNFLAARKMNREALDSIMDRLFPKRVKNDGQPVAAARRENIIADILKIYELNDGNAFPEQRGTAYNLLNAITNFTDHERSTKTDGRAESAMFGSGNDLKVKALEVILQTADGLEVAAPRKIYAAPSVPETTGSALLDSVLANS